MVLPTILKLNKYFQLYQDDSNKKHPIMPLLIYLLQKGCSWEATNKDGKKASDILLENGCPREIVNLLDRTAENWKRYPIGPNGCMGQNGKCALAPAFRVSCPHKSQDRF